MSQLISTLGSNALKDVYHFYKYLESNQYHVPNSIIFVVCGPWIQVTYLVVFSAR